MLSVGKTAKLLGISIRTLHYYDEINLVKPSYTAPSGYRYYDDDAVELLQQVIFLRELEIPVKQIKKILGSPDCDREFLLKGHRQLLLARKAHIENLISLIDKRIGVDNMDYREGIAEEQLKSEFVERFPEFSLFYRLFSPLDSEMICIFPYFYPCEESAREIREIFI